MTRKPRRALGCVNPHTTHGDDVMIRSTLFTALLLAAPFLAARPLVDVAVTDLDQGSVLPTYLDRGKTYVAGVPGHRYTLTLRNQTGARVLAVVSVDGVNAVTG